MAEEYIDNFESLINEAMHIADAVRSISKNLFYKTLTLIETHPYIKPKTINDPVKYGAFSYKSSYGVSFDVIWDYYNFRNQEEYLSTDVNPSCKFYPENNIVYMVVVAINNKIDEDRIAEAVQHEVSHMFEFYNGGKIGTRHINAKEYDDAVDDLLDSTAGSLKYDIAVIIYMKNKMEQRAFANGAYQFLMRSGDYAHNFENAKKRTLLYKYAEEVKDAYENLSAYKGDEPELMEHLRPYKITLDRLLKDTIDVRKRLAWLLGRIVSKAIDDYRRMHGVRIMVTPDNSRKISEATERNRMSVIEKYYKGTPLWHDFCSKDV